MHSESINNKNTIAIWYDRNLKVELDVNLSIISDSKFIEFGVKVEVPENISSKINEYYVNLYLPFLINDNELIPIKLSNNLPLIRAMFNEEIDITIRKYVKIKYQKNVLNKEFCIRDLKDINIERNNFYSIIKIKVIHSSNECKAYYYRFRVNKMNAFYKAEEKNIPFIDGFFKKNEIIDFTINKEDRLYSDIVNVMKHYKTKIYRSNVFVIATEKEDLIEDYGYDKKISASDIWRKHYLNNGLMDDLVVYHYKGKEGLYLKFELNKTSRFIYLIVFLLLIITFIASFKTMLCKCS